MDKTIDIIIIGAGMVGASAALALAQQGHSIALIEHGNEHTFDESKDYNLRVSAISPSSEKLLASVGVWPLIKAKRNCAYHKMTVWDEHSNGQLNFDAGNQAQSHLGHIIENSLLTYALHQHIQHNPLIHTYWQTSVSSINNSEQSVSVQLSSNQSLKAQLLIAADGKFSATRQLLNIQTVSNSYQQHAIVANVNTELNHQHTAWQRFLSTGPLAFLPLNNQQSSIVWSCTDERAKELMSLNDNDFCQQLGTAFEHKLGHIKKTSQRASFPLSWQYAEHTVKNRCILMGDAAHSIHPLAGQGVNLGFADVQLLSQLLTPKKLLKPHKLLRQYERQRKYDSSITLHSMTAINQLFSNKQRLVIQARAWGMNLINQQTGIKRSLIQQAANNIST